MTADDANHPSPEPGPESPSPPPSGSPLDADHAIDLLNEMDAYITHLKDEHTGSSATKETPTPPRKKRAPAPPSPHQPAPQTGQAPQQPVDSQVQRTQDWVDDRTNALDTRQERIENEAAALEIERADLTNLKVKLSQQNKAIEQERQALAQEKKQLAKARLQLEGQAVGQQASGGTTEEATHNTNVTPSVTQSDQTEIDQQKRRLQTRKRQLEQAYEKLKEKMAAFENQRRAFDKQRLQFVEQQRQAQSGRPQSQAPGNANNAEIEQQFRRRYDDLKTDETVIDLARQQYAELLEQRQIVVEAARYLPIVEQEMIRRWSTHRGVGLVGGAVSCLLFIFLFSYSIGQRIVEPVWRATTVVGVSASVFDESSYGTNWMTNTHQLLVGDELLEEAIRLAAQRGGAIFESVPAMREALSHGMALELAAPGQVLIEFRHTNPKLAVDALNALGRAFVNHHIAEDRIAGRPNSMRTYRDAAIDPDPVEDRRLAASVITLGFATAIVAVFAVLLRWWLARSIRVFDRDAIPELDQLEDEELWPTEPAGLDSEPSQDSDQPEDEDGLTPSADTDDEQIELEEDAVLGQAIDDDEDDDAEDRAA